MTSDGELLRAYAETGSEEAFAELVQRHVNLVYSAALRQLNGDAPLAEDVAQTVFTDLARKAAALSNRAALTGWLYTSTCFAAAKAVRSEQRRRAREQEAHTMRDLHHDPAPDPDWNQLRSTLDNALQALREDDREAILLRFFENRPLAEVGAQLGLSENAARMRLDRALDKLRAHLARRGLTTSGAALSAAISANAIHAAPIGLAASLTTTALSGAAAGATIPFTVLKLMSLTKVQLGVTALVLVGAATTVVLQQRAQNSLRRENNALRQDIAGLQTNRDRLSGRVRPNTLTLSLPAPLMPAPTSQPDPLPDWGSTNLIVRLQHGEKAPSLTAEQADSYLDANHRSASSLLAAFRATGDRKLLEEALQKYPNDPQVAFTAAYAPDTSPEERRRCLDAFKQSAPDNSLANYLSALDHFRSGRREQAIQDLNAAAGKQNFQDYSLDFVQNGADAYRAAGYPEVEARIIPSMALVLPHLAELKQLNRDVIDLATAYRNAGDESSAQAALQMDAALGQRVSGPQSTALITQLVGMTIESMALKQMDPASPYGSSGQTVREHLDQLTERRTRLSDFARQLDSIYETVSPADWISYHDRWYGQDEESAMRWLLDKYARK